MAIGLDNRDDATQLAKQIEKDIPVIAGRVNRQKRQLGSKDPDLITISALRASVVCFVQGIGGVQFQTKNVEIPLEVQDHYRAAGALWFDSVATAMGDALLPENRALTFAAAPAVWTAIGALGHDILVELYGEDQQGVVDPETARSAFQAWADTFIRPVDWRRGDHWQAVGAKKSSSGAVTLGGPKETASLIFKGLKDGALKSAPVLAAA
jgi:hypothetical protein